MTSTGFLALRAAALPIVLLLSASVARADDVDDRLSHVEATMASEQSKVLTIEQRLAAASGTLDAQRAVERFQAAVYQYLLGHHDQAAEQFFVLVASGVLEAEGLQSEAEFYLGESLLALGYDEMAEDQYVGLLGRQDDPFRPEAVRRLLEVYARAADSAKFDALFDREIVRGGVRPNDLIVYSLGKALRAKGELARAKAYLGGIDKKSPYWTRARYLVGAMLVEQGDAASLADAGDVFQEIGLVEPKTPEDRDVRDLALLALGRLQNHLGRADRAVDAYLRVPEDSPHRDDQLQELVWLYIGQKQTGAALETVEKFLKAFPDHPVAAELRLVRGHLQFELGDPDRALVTYEEVAKAYAPVRDRFRALSAQVGDAHAFVEEVLAAVEAAEAKAAKKPDAAPIDDTKATAAALASEQADLPGYAAAVMTQDPAFRRTIALWREVGWTTAALEAAEALIGELRGALAGSGPEDLIEGARFATVDGRVAALEQRLAVAGVEADWLLGVVPSQGPALTDVQARRKGAEAELQQLAGRVAAQRATLDARLAERDPGRRREVDARVASLTTQLAQLPPGDAGRGPVETALVAAKAQQASLASSPSGPIPGLDALVADADGVIPRLTLVAEDLERRLRGVRNAAALDAVDARAARVDALRGEIGRATGRLERIARVLSGVGAEELSAVQGIFDREVVAVAEARAEIAGDTARVDDVAAEVTRRNLDRLAGLFGEHVLDAEMGAVNVHWTRWVQSGEERRATAEERARELAEAARAFKLLEQKLGR